MDETPIAASSDAHINPIDYRTYVAALFAVAEYRGVEATLIVAISDELFHPWQPGFHAGLAL